MEKEKIDRRSFLIRILWGASGIVAAAASVPMAGALLEPLFRKYPVAWRVVGKTDDFVVGQTVLVKFRSNSALPWTGVTSQTAAWLRRVSKDQFIAFSVNCTHLGCPVRWIQDAEMFMCPCHGGVYNKDGSYAAGPPPHDLPHYPVRIAGGQVEIQAVPVPITKI